MKRIFAYIFSLITLFSRSKYDLGNYAIMLTYFNNAYLVFCDWLEQIFIFSIFDDVTIFTLQG